MNKISSVTIDQIASVFDWSFVLYIISVNEKQSVSHILSNFCTLQLLFIDEQLLCATGSSSHETLDEANTFCPTLVYVFDDLFVVKSHP